MTSVGKVIGKGKYTAPKSEMSGAVLATRLFRKIQEELTNVKVSRFRFVGDSTIVLQMIAKNKPATLDSFFGTRLLKITDASNPNQWFWIAGKENPADLLTRQGCNAAAVGSPLWMNGGVLNGPEDMWGTVSCQELRGEGPAITIKRFDVGEVSGLSVMIRRFMKILQSRHLNDLARFMEREEVELEGAGEEVTVGAEDGARGNIPASEPPTKEVQDEIGDQDPVHGGSGVEGQHG